MTKFAPVNLEELFSITNSFKDGKVPGADNIPISVIKKSIDVISDPLLSLINLSLSSGTFPDKLKIAKITPILKTGDACLVQNYRPITVLPAFSKIFERVVYNRIFKFITDNKILCSNQYGFRPGHSTSHALISFVNKVANTVDSNNYLAGVFLDLSKVFDTLDHAILLQKLEIYGVTEIAHKWITDYFTNRKQFVLVNESKSCLHNQICGVPQGSILGPLFFILYINDLPNCSNTLCSILFADDTSLFIEHKDPNILINQLNCESQNVSDWLRANKLSINVSKTKLIIFRPRQRSLPNISPLIIDNNVVELVESTKFLGVYIDQHLTWKTHINVISKKIAKSIGLTYKANFYLHQNSLLLLYYALIYPYLTYCNLIWASTYVTNLQRIYLLQKRAVRLISKSDCRAPSKPLFAKMKILDIFSIYSLQASSFMYLYHKNKLPLSFSEVFQTGSQIHHYSTRTSESYRSHSCRTNFKKFSILFQGPKIWNSLPMHIKAVSSFQSFKQLMKSLLRDKQENVTQT